jgi:hypothetical protein
VGEWEKMREAGNRNVQDTMTAKRTRVVSVPVWPEDFDSVVKY